MAGPGHYPEVYDRDVPDSLLSAPCSQGEIFSLYCRIDVYKRQEQDYKKLEKELDKKIKRTPTDPPGYNLSLIHI